jgi:hypothetical protein
MDVILCIFPQILTEKYLKSKIFDVPRSKFEKTSKIGHF